ncbi:MAG: PilZ domain-containing protein [Leptospiraceae bacterium]|nr:PilZ domain-containing protein [Leptospiraceae bacterium]
MSTTDNKKQNTSNLYQDRKENRRHLIYYLKVDNSQTNELIGRVVDITAKGLLMISRNKFDTQLEIPVRIELGDELFEQTNGHLKLNIRCRWSKEDINPDYFVTGFEFINQTVEQESLINKLIDVIGFRD